MVLNYYTICIGLIAGLILFYKLPGLKKSKTFSRTDFRISVIIPVRNEEINLPGLLGDLKKQSCNIHEIICVDDNSEDNTEEIIKKFGVNCVKLDGLPDGWKGKPWACQKGAEAATGDVLLFIDADVRLNEDAVYSLIMRYKDNGNPLSVQPYHSVQKRHEHFSFFFNLIEICATGMSIPGNSKRGFYGPLFMILKELFDEHGGYETVRDSVMEDFNLGRHYSSQGINIDLMLGLEHVQFRMYPKSFQDLFEGWSKNFASGSLSMLWWMLVMVFAWIAFLTILPYELIRAVATGNLLILAILSIIYVLNIGLVYRVSRKTGSFPLYVSILYPVYLLMFHVIFIYSVLATFVFKSTTWKGRNL